MRPGSWPDRPGDLLRYDGADPQHRALGHEARQACRQRIDGET